MPLYDGIGLINEKLPVVLEIGTALTKVGFAGENFPRAILPSVQKTKRKDGTEHVESLHKIKDEHELNLALVEFLNTIYFRHLLVTPKDRKVVILESLFTSSKWRNTLARVLYIHYEVQNILWIPTHLAASVGIGADTALIVDIGQVEANVIPLINGVTLLSSLLSYELGANAFDANLMELLQQHAMDPKEGLRSRLRPELIEDIRVRSCFVAPMARAEKFNEIQFLEPKLKPFQISISENELQYFDGVVRELGPEVWFQTEDLDGVSLPQMILDVLSKCPIDSRLMLAKSILITGGTSILPGFKGRFIRELKKLISKPSYADKFNSAYEFRMFELPIEQNCASWFGGSVYGSSEAMTLRGTPKEYFLKHGELPDWASPSNSNYAAFGLPTSNPVIPVTASTNFNSK